MAKEHRVNVERLQDIDGWEFFQLVREDDWEPKWRIALRADMREGTVEYGLWRQTEEEPRLTDRIECEAATGPWADGAREEAIRAIVYKHEDAMKIAQGRLKFCIEGPPEEESEDSVED